MSDLSPLVITLDGPAGTGKSTVATLLAERLDRDCCNTGALYRAITWKILQTHTPLTDEVRMAQLLQNIDLTVRKTGRKISYFIGDHDLTHALRDAAVTELVSQVAALPQVRQTLSHLQQEIARSGVSIFEGRDMGTAIFPHADLKFYLDASAQVRAKRRWLELPSDEQNTHSLEKIQSQLLTRDHLDSTRVHAPLKQPTDAIVIDTSYLTAEEVVDQIVAHYTQRFAQPLPLYRKVILCTRLILKIFYRLQVYGRSHYVQGGSLIAANHSSFLDPPAIAVACSDQIHFLARKSLFKGKFGQFLRKINTHPIEKSGQNLLLMKEITRLLKDQKKVLIFPEGTRSSGDQQLGAIKPGLGLLMNMSRSILTPVYIHGTFKIWPRNNLLPKPWGKISVVFGSPIRWSTYAHLPPKEARIAIGELFQKRLERLKSWLAQGATGTPP